MNSLHLEQFTKQSKKSKVSYTDVSRCRALLRDVFPGHKLEVNLLIGALEDGIPAKISAGEKMPL